MSRPQSSAPAPEEPSEWTEKKLVESLRRLDDLHGRLIGLRTVIPKILHPLTTDYATPVDMFEDFSSRALSCSDDIATFNTLYVKSTPIFEYAAATRSRDPVGIRRLRVGETFLADEQLMEGDGGDVEMKDVGIEEKEEQPEEEAVENTKDEDVAEVLEEFAGRLMHRDVEVEELPGGTSARRYIKVVLPPPSSLLFAIEITPAADKSCAFVVTSIKSAKRPDAPVQNLHTGILRAVMSRQWPGNLEMLLEMLAAYKTVFSVKCEKCKRLIAGSKAELPVVRKLVRDGAGKEKRWIALHEGCV